MSPEISVSQNLIHSVFLINVLQISQNVSLNKHFEGNPNMTLTCIAISTTSLRKEKESQLLKHCAGWFPVLLSVTTMTYCTLCKVIHVQQNDTCPMIIPQNCACVQQVLIG